MRLWRRLGRGGGREEVGFQEVVEVNGNARYYA